MGLELRRSLPQSAIDVTNKTHDRFWSSWPVLLAGAQIIWIAHFFVVYLWAEASCNRLADSAVRLITLSATIVAVVAITLLIRRTWKLRGQPIFYAGFLLSALALVATLFVGLPALFLDPC
jgi:hypothetical protein